MSSKEITIKGIVQTFNISPKGVYEGMLIKTANSTVQVNFSREIGGYISSRFFEEGREVELMAEAQPKSDKGKAEHKVFELIRFTDAKNNKTHLHHEHETVSVKGKVVSLNYALHGEINGAVLDNGDFIHLKPHGAKAVKLDVGQKLEVEGELRPSFLNHRVIEADVVNGTALHEHKEKSKRKHG